MSKQTRLPQNLKMIAPLLLSVLIANYQACVDREAPRSCQNLYRPIQSYCRKLPGGCHADLPQGKRGALSFYRCFHQSSCEVGQGLTARIYPGDERAEVRDPYEADYGEAIDYRLSLKIPEGSELSTDNNSIVLFQVKANNDLSPPVALRWKGSDFTITVRHPAGENVIYRGSMALAKWHKFIIRVTTGAPGLLTVYMNGSELIQYRGNIGYPGTFTYFKMGPYDYTRTQKTPLAIHYGYYWRTSITYPEG